VRDYQTIPLLPLGNNKLSEGEPRWLKRTVPSWKLHEQGKWMKRGDRPTNIRAISDAMSKE
jgi:hypothetical protein